MGAHLVTGEFQSDKHPTTPRGKVPLSVTAEDLLWAYAQQRRSVDAEFSDDLETALLAAGFTRPQVAPTQLEGEVWRGTLFVDRVVAVAKRDGALLAFWWRASEPPTWIHAGAVETAAIFDLYRTESGAAERRLRKAIEALFAQLVKMTQGEATNGEEQALRAEVAAAIGNLRALGIEP